MKIFVPKDNIFQSIYHLHPNEISFINSFFELFYFWCELDKIK